MTARCGNSDAIIKAAKRKARKTDVQPSQVDRSARPVRIDDICPPWHCLRARFSRQQFLNNSAMHVSEAEVAALEAIGEPGVIEPEQME